MTGQINNDPTRAMYEALPFPQRGGDHADYARMLMEQFARHSPPKAGKWLDLGCGTGEIFCELAKLNPGMQFAGLDFSEASLEHARRRIGQERVANASVRWGDITDPSWADGTWDVVTAMGSIIVMPEADVGFANAMRALRPGGFFAFYFYGTYGRYDRTLRQRLLSILAPAPHDFQTRVDLARRIFAPTMHTGEPMTDPWIADQFAHPSENVFTIMQIYDILQSGGLELLEWLFVSERPEDHFQDPLVVERCKSLSRRDRLAVFDLLLRKVDNVVIAKKMNAA